MPITPVFCCGFECGRLGTVGEHWTSGTGVSTVTTPVRNGARALRVNPSAAANFSSHTASANSRNVLRFAIRFASLPTADAMLMGFVVGTQRGGIAFKSSDSKIYAASYSGSLAMGATGVSVTTGAWYYIDVFVDSTTFAWTVDARVNGTACGQHTRTLTGGNCTVVELGSGALAATFDAYFDDIVWSQTGADFPIGDGYVNHFVPTSDGTHNVAGANDFERSATGTDINNTTTTAYQLVDDVPLKATTPTEFINMVAPPNIGDYVQVVMGPAPGISTPTVGPRAVEVIALVAQAATGLGSMGVTLVDNGSPSGGADGNTYLASGVAGIVAGKYVTKQFADPPSAATVWGVTSGNGNFNDVRVNFGPGQNLDVNPDQYLASLMIEAEFAAPVVAGLGRMLAVF